MSLSSWLLLITALAPLGLMFALTLAAYGLSSGANADKNSARLWLGFKLLSGLATLAALLALGLHLFSPGADQAAQLSAYLPGLALGQLSAWVVVLVQLLGTVIGVFSARYLWGEGNQARYIAALAGVLAAVQLLLLADNWLVLIAAWAAAGKVLQSLLCFYAERPFAQLAAHKKRIADRAADALLIAAALAAYAAVGSFSISDLLAQAGGLGNSIALQLSAIALVLAVILRTALLPVHGWLIQVMEAPTPVSALLHAGVVNLGGFVLISFAPLLEVAPAARWLLVIFGLTTAVLAGFVMLTRISIKVRLAWSTVAQMGFMVLECGLGLYELAVLHLLGHSLYKAHSFLAASTVVRQTRLQMLRGNAAVLPLSLLLAPVLAFASIALLQGTLANDAWPWWWTAILALAWAPILWLPVHAKNSPTNSSNAPSALLGLASGVGMVLALTMAALLAHALPFGVTSAAKQAPGLLALVGMVLLYLGLATLQSKPGAWPRWRRLAYAGFYVDELFTRLAFKLKAVKMRPAGNSTAVPITAPNKVAT